MTQPIAMDAPTTNIVNILAAHFGFDANEAIVKVAEASVRSKQTMKQPTIITEDLGKQFEMAICTAFDTPYVGPYKYSAPNADLVARCRKLRTHWTQNCTHTAERGSPHDFTDTADPTNTLSAKTNKKVNGMVAPQVIGQPSVQKMARELELDPQISANDLKRAFMETHTNKLLELMVRHTFGCPIAYYIQPTNSLLLITLNNVNGFTQHLQEANKQWSRPLGEWGNSNRLAFDNGQGDFIPLIECQFHTKSRQNLANRWCLQKLIGLYSDWFTVIEL